MESDVPCRAMKTTLRLLTLFSCALIFQACNNVPTVQQKTTPPTPATIVYVTNEASGDLSVIDTATNQVIATVSLGKRPRGIHFSRDGKQLFVALSGSPIAG